MSDSKGDYYEDDFLQEDDDTMTQDVLKYVSSDRDDIRWVLGKVLQYAQKEFKTMYLVQRSGFYWMTDYPPEFKKRIATVYPGGRILLRGRQVTHD